MKLYKDDTLNDALHVVLHENCAYKNRTMSLNYLEQLWNCTVTDLNKKNEGC